MMPQMPHIPVLITIEFDALLGEVTRRVMLCSKIFAQPSVLVAHLMFGRPTETPSLRNDRDYNDQTFDDQITGFLRKHLLEIKPHVEKRLARNAPRAADAWVLQDNVILVEPAYDGVVSASHWLPVVQTSDRAHPIHNDRHSPPKPFFNCSEVRSVKHFRFKTELLRTLPQVRSGRSTAWSAATTLCNLLF